MSLDLIYGAPGESDADWQTSLDAALAAGPTHVSAYALIVEEGTRLGAQVRMVVRDVDKGEEVRRALAGRLPGADLVVDRCDVGDLDDVRRFVDGLDVPHLDVLVHNAGAMPPQRTESKQGHELTMALHVLGPVLMTELLRPRLTDGRVVLVTSGGMFGQRLRDDIGRRHRPIGPGQTDP